MAEIRPFHRALTAVANERNSLEHPGDPGSPSGPWPGSARLLLDFGRCFPGRELRRVVIGLFELDKLRRRAGNVRATPWRC